MYHPIVDALLLIPVLPLNRQNRSLLFQNVLPLPRCSTPCAVFGIAMQELISIESSDRIKDLIYTVRGVKVMLDSDLAEIYGYQTGRFNQQVKNNIE